jgi:hypothetical protein
MEQTNSVKHHTIEILKHIRQAIPNYFFTVLIYGTLTVLCMQLISDHGILGILISIFLIYFFPNSFTAYCTLVGYLLGRFVAGI